MKKPTVYIYYTPSLQQRAVYAVTAKVISMPNTVNA